MTGPGAEQAGPSLGEASLDGAALTGEQLLDRLREAGPVRRTVAERVEQLRGVVSEPVDAYVYTVGWLTSVLEEVLAAALAGDAGALQRVGTAAADGLVMAEACRTFRRG